MENEIKEQNGKRKRERISIAATNPLEVKIFDEIKKAAKRKNTSVNKYVINQIGMHLGLIKAA